MRYLKEFGGLTVFLIVSMICISILYYFQDELEVKYKNTNSDVVYVYIEK